MSHKRRWLVGVGLCLLAGWGALSLPGQRQAHSQEPAPDASGVGAGFTAAFEDEVKKIGQITPDQFAQRFASKAEYAPKLRWDATAAKFWEQFCLDPRDGKAIKFRSLEEKPNLSQFDFRLNPQELALFKQNGFVVSERLGSHSFTDLYYRIYVRDLPVFITSDSMLHAWHRYFDRLLEEMETDYFQPAFKQMLKSMAAEIPAAKEAYGQGPMAEALNDVDFFLAVAQSLLGAPGHSKLGQQLRVNEAVQACFEEQMVKYPLFGRLRPIDFSQFKPRGRYDQNADSQNYFRAVMWLGRIDFRIAGSDSPPQDLRELSGAIVLNDLLQRAGMRERWTQLDRVLLQLIGRADSLNFTQLGEVLTGFGAAQPANITAETLAALRTRILESKIGEQHIRGEWFLVDPSNPAKFVLPRTFAFMGQRFILDSWALAKIVYDDIIWNEEKIQRRIPSSLDVGFAVFGNDHVTSLLAARQKDEAGRKFRDGLPYQHNLAAVRNIIERMPDTTWKESVYADWLGCLRELSKPTTDKQYPEAVRTSAWALKSTATQLASWTQLRHDTVLYAKPSYSSGEACFYPAGYVEPVPHFWQRFEQMVQRTKGVIEKTKFPDERFENQGTYTRDNHLRRLDHFAKAAASLRGIAEKQMAQQELDETEKKFLKNTVVDGGGSGMPPVSGWYPNLFTKRSKFKDQDDAHKWVALVTDVHTDPPFPSVGDPGCVLHQAVGNVDAMLIAIDNGKDRMVYAGPVFSHYEFETPNAVRRTNGEWHDTLRAGKQPKRADWTSSYLVPGVNPEVKDYGKVDNRWGGK